MQEKINVLEHTAGLSSNSIEEISTSTDINQCLGEYIWNGFDAGASIVEINTVKNSLGGIELIEIKDNGCGINYNKLSKTFKVVLDSEKISKKLNDNIHGSKGRGRFAFVNFAESAIWETVYKEKKESFIYEIRMNKKNAQNFTTTEPLVYDSLSYTKVTLSNINPLKNVNLESPKFTEFLNKNFASFLYLNKNKQYKILINGVEFNYMKTIDEEVSEYVEKEIDGSKFEIHFIKWIGKIDEDYYFYFRNNKNEQVYKAHTTFNKKSMVFPHSVYVKSKYFDDFEEINNSNTSSLLSKFNQKSSTFKELCNYLISILGEKIREYIKVKAPQTIDHLEKKGAFPKFKNTKYEQLRKEDLKDVLTELYVIEPKILDGSLKQQKTIIAFLNLLLESDEREGIINIMDNINKLSSEERRSLNELLQKTTLSKIIKTVSMIQNRLEVIETLKTLVYDLEAFTNERDHIQKIIEENYWLFGENYHLVSADKNFEVALSKYIYKLEGYKDEERYLKDNPQKLRRPDIFMCRSQSLNFENSTQGEENIIVELKAPKVVLSIDIYRQVEDYMRLITKEPRFNSTLRRWKFIMVGKSVDEDIKSLYDNVKDKGQNFLVKGGKDFEIYAMTWDDVFKMFEINHKYILNKLEIEKRFIENDISDMSNEEGRALVNEITNEILNLKESI